jgi:Mechanosensitive ion channel, conserved TM helix
MRAFWEQAIVGPLRDLGRQALASLSSLIGMLALIVLGLILGWIAKEIVYRLLRALRFDRLCDRIGVGQVVERTGLARSSSYLAGQIIEGMIILTALLAGLNALGTPLTRNLVDRFFLYLPHLLAAVVVLIVGALVSRFLSRSALIAAVNAQMPSARLLAGLTRFFVIALTVVAALDELGISRTTIIVTFAILFGGVVTAAAIALGLGARDIARDLLHSQFRPKGQPEVEDSLRHL